MAWSFIGNVVVHCVGGTWDEEAQRIDGPPRQLGEFYAELLGMEVVRDDWIKIGENPTTYPQIAIDGVKSTSAYQQPRWPDPRFPAQMHMHISVPDLAEAAGVVEAGGGMCLQSGPCSLTVADPVGHPICLSQGEKRRINSVVLECLNPEPMAAFYTALLGMGRDEADADHWMLRRPDGGGPALSFQAIDGYEGPSWGDDSRHQQMHLDIWFEDVEAASVTAERFGGRRLPYEPPHPVYADPAGHPFCMLSMGQ